MTRKKAAGATELQNAAARAATRRATMAYKLLIRRD